MSIISFCYLRDYFSVEEILCLLYLSVTSETTFQWRRYYVYYIFLLPPRFFSGGDIMSIISFCYLRDYFSVEEILCLLYLSVTSETTFQWRRYSIISFCVYYYVSFCYLRDYFSVEEILCYVYFSVSFCYLRDYFSVEEILCLLYLSVTSETTFQWRRYYVYYIFLLPPRLLFSGGDVMSIISFCYLRDYFSVEEILCLLYLSVTSETTFQWRRCYVYYIFLLPPRLLFSGGDIMSIISFCYLRDYFSVEEILCLLYLSVTSETTFQWRRCYVYYIFLLPPRLLFSGGDIMSIISFCYLRDHFSVEEILCLLYLSVTSETTFQWRRCYVYYIFLLPPRLLFSGGDIMSIISFCYLRDYFSVEEILCLLYLSVTSETTFQWRRCYVYYIYIRIKNIE